MISKTPPNLGQMERQVPPRTELLAHAEAVFAVADQKVG